MDSGPSGWALPLWEVVVAGSYVPMEGRRWSEVPEEGKQLVARLHQVEPNKRPTAEEVLDHPWFLEEPEVTTPVWAQPSPQEVGEEPGALRTIYRTFLLATKYQCLHLRLVLTYMITMLCVLDITPVLRKQPYCVCLEFNLCYVDGHVVCIMRLA